MSVRVRWREWRIASVGNVCECVGVCLCVFVAVLAIIMLVGVRVAACRIAQGMTSGRIYGSTCHHHVALMYRIFVF